MNPGTWWEGIPPTDVAVACDGARHRLRWERGSLLALEHENSPGEQLLAVLGGEEVGCYQVMAMWRAHVSDVRVLTLGPRALHDRVQADPAELEALEQQLEEIARIRGVLKGKARGGVTGGTTGTQAQVRSVRSVSVLAGVLAADHLAWRSQSELLSLFSWPRAMIDRLVLGAWAEHAAELRRAVDDLSRPATEDTGTLPSGAGGRSANGPALYAAAVGSAAATLRRWLGARSDQVDVELSEGAALQVAIAGTSPGRRARARVGSDWIPTIWARQMSLIDGHLVTELVDVDEERAVVRALVVEDGELQPAMTVELRRHPRADAWTISRN